MNSERKWGELNFRTNRNILKHIDVATLNFFIRTESNKEKWCRIRVRFRMGSGCDNSAKTNIWLPVQAWDRKRQKVKRSIKHAHIISMDMIETIEEKLNRIEKNVFENVIKNPRIIQTKNWLQKIVDSACNDTSSKPYVKSDLFHKDYIPLMNYIEQYVHQAECGYRLTLKRGEKFSCHTIRSLKNFRNIFKEYCFYYKITPNYNDIDMDFYFKFKHYLSINKNYAANTTGRIIQTLKTIMLAARDNGFHENFHIYNRAFKVDNFRTDNIFLNMEQLSILYEISNAVSPYSNLEPDIRKTIFVKYSLEHISDSILKKWSDILDVFLVGCHTGQRFSDYSRINRNMICMLYKKEFIKITQQKTKTTVYIPIRKEVYEILKRHNGILPYVREQELNACIKKICRHAGFTQQVAVKIRKGGNTTVIQSAFYNLVKSHTARRSLATNMYKMGTDLASIMSITGHSSEAVLKRYLKLDEIEKGYMAANSKYYNLSPCIKSISI